MKKARLHIFAFVALVVAASGCSSSPGPDSISSRQRSGSGNSACTAQCHSSSSTISPDPLVTNGTGTYGKHVAHVENSGIPCERCHFDYLNNSSHMNGTLDTPDPAVLVVYFDSANPTGTWTGDTGPSTGSCSSLTCHGSDTPAWYLTGQALSCTTCHSQAIGTRRAVAGASGDFALNSSIVSHHVTGTGDPSRDQCLVCHDQSTHTSGTVRLRNADNDAISYAYDPNAAGTLEPFCLSCHDANGALATGLSGTSNPFNDGSRFGVVPFVAGNKIAGYWNGAANIHKTTGGLTCAGSGLAATGCHGNNGTINMHGSTNAGLLTNLMNFQIPLTFDTVNPANTFVYNNYKLCFDCHDNYPAVSKETVLGYKQGGKYDFAWAPTPYYTSGIQSLFRDRYIDDPLNYPSYWGGVFQAYNDDVWLGTYAPLHNYHLLGDIPVWLNWKYRGDPARIGRITCTTCHNVHGTNGTVRSTYEEFGIIPNSPYVPMGPDQYKTFADPMSFQDAIMKAYPINCNVNCHAMMGTSSYWHDPADE
jgi:predicted CxxxxCH...CXXCH cytochrome family protein